MNRPSHYLFPAVIEQAENNVGLYFPDIPGTAVTGSDIFDAIKRAKDLLADVLYDIENQGKNIPVPSQPQQIEMESDTDRIVYIDIWMPPYRDQSAQKVVTKNCTLPRWLRDAGEEAGLNFSQILQTAVKKALNISDSHN